MSPQAALLSRLQPGFRSPQAPHLHGAPHFIPADSHATSEAIVHVVCSDADQISNLTAFFASHQIRVKAFSTATEYIANAGFDQTACVILDLNLSDINGLEVQRSLADREGPPVVFVAAHSDLNSGVRAMKNGAIDFMIEPFDYNRLLAAVETAFAQDRRKRLERVERSSLLRRWRSLTPREQEVFQFTVAGFLNKQAASELGITENTFQVHRGRVMRKMTADSLADLVRMSTRLESLFHPEGNNETTTQSLKAILQGQIDGGSKGSAALAGAHRPYANRISTPVAARFGSLRYAESGRA